MVAGVLEVEEVSGAQVGEVGDGCTLRDLLSAVAQKGDAGCGVGGLGEARAVDTKERAAAPEVGGLKEALCVACDEVWRWWSGGYLVGSTAPAPPLCAEGEGGTIPIWERGAEREEEVLV